MTRHDRRPMPAFETEAALCQAFALRAPDEWVIYPETCNWDMLLVHRVGQWQIGVEAKLSLNTKVLLQAVNGRRLNKSGPDFRAVLVGKVSNEPAALARELGITVISPLPLPQSFGRGFCREGPFIPDFAPELPKSENLVGIGEWWSDWDQHKWFDQFPTERHVLPEYVPEVAAGVPSPIILSEWKIKAIRVCVWVEKNGTITRPVFKSLGIDPSRWMNGHWLSPAEPRGVWKAGDGFPGNQLRREHPSIYAKIEADYAKWSAKVAP